MSSFISVLSDVLLIAGAVFVLIGLIGVFRMPDFYTRLHAASIIDTLGSMLIILGLILIAGISLISMKLLMIMLFVLVTTPTAAHALAKSALHGKLQPQLEKQAK